VRAESDVAGARRAGRSDEAVITDADESDVVQLQWESGIVELARVGDLQKTFGGAVRSGASEVSVPQFRALTTRQRDGADTLALEAAQHIAVDRDSIIGQVADAVVDKVSEYVLPAAVRKIEEQRVPQPGLWFVNRDGSLKEPVGSLAGKISAEPYLVLVHGTFSNTDTAFKHLFATDEWQQLYARYAKKDGKDLRVLALEQRTVSDSPARNAAQLVEGLGSGARLHLLTHSRGGLVGDLLCRSAWTEAEVEAAFAGNPYAGVRADLEDLRRQLFLEKGRAVQVERFLRVAAPAAGTQLAGRRLDQFLSVGLTLLGKAIDAGAGWFDVVKSIAVHLVSARTRADACPGLEAMMPGSPLVRFLNTATLFGDPPLALEGDRTEDAAARERRESEAQRLQLAVVSGDVQGGRWFQRVKEVFADFYFKRKANDFIVDTESMKRGVQRRWALHYHREGAEADHFSYFRDREIRARVISYLADGRPDGFVELERGTDAIPARSRLFLGDSTVTVQKRPNVATVFLVPGIMGTRLADQNRKVIWVNLLSLAQGGLRKLMLPDNGVILPLAPIEVAYQRVVRFLERELNVQLFGYDWRQSIKLSSERLADELEVAFQESDQPVHLLAHSMGGLVSRGLIAWRPRTWEKLVERGGRLVMLGTPNFGSFVPAQALLGQLALLNKLDFLDQASNIEELIEVVMSFDGLMQMLPKRGVVDGLNPKAIDWLSFENWQKFPKFRSKDEQESLLKGVLERASAVREELDAAVGSEKSMFYVAGQAATPVELELSSTSAVFSTSEEGDETVPWALGRLPDVPTFYVNTTHGKLADHRDSFPGYLELLKHGRTTLLATEPRARSFWPSRDGTAGAGEPPLQRLAPQLKEDIVYFPSEQDVVAGFIDAEGPAEERGEEPLAVSVVNGHIQASRFPIVVGHYQGDPITSVESVLDRWLGGQLRRDHALRIYPGPIGTMRWYKHPNGGERGVIVVGLGRVSALNRLRLAETLREGLLRYAADRYQLGEPGTPVELTLTSLLIGSWGKLTVEDSVAAMIAAVRDCNQRLNADPSRFVKYVAVQFMELYRDLATQAARALLRLQDSDRLLRVSPHIKTLGTVRRHRPAAHLGYYDRVSILSQEDVSPPPPVYVPQAANLPGQPPTVPAPPPPGPPRPDFISYDTVTGLARSTLRKRCVQWAHIEKLLSQATLGDKGAVDTLFQYLVPYELKDQAGDSSDLVIELDNWTAQIPWELMTVDENEGDALVRRGILRTLQIDRPRRPQPTNLSQALVIGEPMGVYPALPGARSEGDEVARLLTGAGVLTRALLGADADDNFRALLESSYDIIHIAAHGHFDAQNPRHSGVVLANGRFLTACEFENLKSTPSIVFLNCCHLGQVRLREPGAWASSVAEELIRIGVSVVVVAGWAVSDQPALVFARTLYGRLLQGDNLMTAVREARRKTRDASAASDVTWGAYQVYGDAGFVLPNRYVSKGDGDIYGATPTWVSPHELVEYVLDLEVRAGEDNEKLGGRLDTRIQALWEDGVPEDWKKLGDVNAAFGKAFGAVGNFEAAIEHYETASSCSDAVTRAMEQLANYRGRQAVRLAEGKPVTTENLQLALTLLVDSLEGLDQLLKLGASSERHSLRAATLRRIERCNLQFAKHGQALAPSPAPSALDAASAAYRAATAAKPGAEFAYYPLLQVQGVELCLNPGNVSAASLQVARDAARKSAHEGDAFAEVVLVELDIIEAAAQVPPDHAKLAPLAKRLFEMLDASGVSQERRESLTSNWQTHALLSKGAVQVWLKAFLDVCKIDLP
jgi:hypothetical protein